SLIQIIKLNVTHGTRLNGVGPTDFLPPGPVSVNVNVQGKTVDEHGDSVTVGASATLKTFAQRVDIGVSAGDVSHDLHTAPKGLWFQGGLAHDGTPVYLLDRDPTGALTVTNTGNVTITVVRRRRDPLTVLDTLRFAPADTFTVSYPVLLEIDPEGVIADPVT